MDFFNPQLLEGARTYAGAHSIINTLLKMGLRVPEDVSIVVIDKDPQQTAALAPISLTGIKLNEWHRGLFSGAFKRETGISPKQYQQSVS